MADRGLIGEHARIQKEAAQLRADAIRHRILALEAFCGIARSQLQLGLVEEARASMEKIRRAQSEIGGHIEDSRHVWGARADELRAMLERMKPVIERLESSIGDHG